ncbi:hypothetical protein DM01DRAFT_1382473 [Hesseltinella vesiculosa]|uniref:Uncharacterized protein n=1 Tax=Hesseltinella vesiculosa TaxID=101127 RepID=A0A1X2GKP5_9FUNG|nr:hypothetical protein DM01DRAFT_1382473 [Hesseltinella vesiculosa]
MMETDELEREFEASVLCPLLNNVASVLSECRLGSLQIRSVDQFQTIKNKISKQSYRSIGSFKLDLDALFVDLRSKNQTHDAQRVEELYNAVLSSTVLELRHLIPLRLTPNTSDQVRVALFRPAMDGFVFTDASSRIPVSEAYVSPHLQSIAVHPTNSFNAPTLKESLYPIACETNDIVKENPVMPVQWLDYGPFASFAPVYDSNNANLSYDMSYSGVQAKQHAMDVIDQQSREAEDMEQDIDSDWLQKQGLDLEAMAHHLAARPKLETNTDLIHTLAQQQDKRFALETHPEIAKAEQDLASQLQQQLADLLRRVDPKDILQSDQVEKAIAQRPHHATSYRGSLPPNKLFALPTSDTLDQPLPPPYTNITPTYAKNQWRLPDAQPSEGTASQ